jgi:ketosteroid isomerase-like protein
LTLQAADASGELGYCILAYAGDYPQSDGSTATERGRSVNVPRRQTDGDWKIQVSSLNTDRP